MTDPIGASAVRQQGQRVERARLRPGVVESDASTAPSQQRTHLLGVAKTHRARSHRLRGEPAPSRRCHADRAERAVATPERPHSRAPPSSSSTATITSRRGNAPTSADPSAVGHLGGGGCLTEGLGQLVPAPHLLALGFQLSPRADDRPTDDREHDERGRQDRGHLDLQAAPCRSKDAGARPVDHGDPARRLRVRVRDCPARPSRRAHGCPSSTPSPCFNLATKARFSGRAKLRSVTCCPARSITTSPSNPRSVVASGSPATAAAPTPLPGRP